jgi:hypothetical protein
MELYVYFPHLPGVVSRDWDLHPLSLSVEVIKASESCMTAGMRFIAVFCNLYPELWDINTLTLVA